MIMIMIMITIAITITVTLTDNDNDNDNETILMMMMMIMIMIVIVIMIKKNIFNQDNCVSFRENCYQCRSCEKKKKVKKNCLVIPIPGVEPGPPG